MKKDGVDVRGNILQLQCGEDPAFGNFMSGGFIVSDQPVTLNRILPYFSSSEDWHFRPELMLQFASFNRRPSITMFNVSQ